ncbi:MAG: hypothetical protein JWN51_3729, partial [Phycisphaerales bacterium]|nr:hypothetical protein [Phycisphaerales bacterium]
LRRPVRPRPRPIQRDRRPPQPSPMLPYPPRQRRRLPRQRPTPQSPRSLRHPRPPTRLQSPMHPPPQSPTPPLPRREPLLTRRPSPRNRSDSREVTGVKRGFQPACQSRSRGTGFQPVLAVQQFELRPLPCTLRMDRKSAQRCTRFIRVPAVQLLLATPPCFLAHSHVDSTAVRRLNGRRAVHNRWAQNRTGLRVAPRVFSFGPRSPHPLPKHRPQPPPPDDHAHDLSGRCRFMPCMIYGPV